jgi:mannitol-specific phosphotransferase system IIBC component
MNTIYGVIVGSVISFAGVIITLRRNQKLHEENLREERRKIKEEREFSSKQAAFLSASEALARFLLYYISLPDRILPSDGTVPEEIAGLSAALTRLHFYCELETITEITHLSQIMNEAIGEVLKAKMPSGFTDGDIKAIDVSISGTEKLNTRVQDEIIAMLQSDPQNPLLASRYEQSAENFKKMANLQEKRNELIKRKYEETEKCRDVVITNLKTINESFRDVLLLARRELSFAIDQESYKSIINKYIESMEGISKEIYSEIRRQFQEKME